MNTVYFTGNTHFDPVWLWRWDEAMSSIRATFRSALDRMKEDSDFFYDFSAPAVFEWILATDPEMFQEIKARVKEGRWALGEGCWLQSDFYTGTGESLVRQGLYGQRWLYRQFGQISRTCYSIDSFGHPDTLPGILSGCGMKNIVFCRPNPETLPLPQPLFRWVGRDGAELLAYQVTNAYAPDAHIARKDDPSIKEGTFSAVPDVAKVIETTLEAAKDSPCDLLAVFGVTDHGGAPTKESIAAIHKAAKEEKGCKVRFSTVAKFFDDQREKPLPTVDKELSVFFIGPSSNHTEVKATNRRAEILATYAETAALFANRLLGRPVDKEKLEGIWRDVLFNQFHDIIGGCCIPSAYTDARDLHGRAAQNAAEEMHYALQSITRNIRMPGKNPEDAWNLCVWNLSGVEGEYEIDASAQWAWEFPWYRGGITLVAEDGEEIPTQALRSDAVIPGFRSRFLFRAKLPGWGWRCFTVKKNNQPAPYVLSKDKKPRTLSAGGLRLELGEGGGIAKLYRGETLLAENLLLPVVQKDICDTWGFNKTVFEEEREPLTLLDWQLVEDGICRTTLKLTLGYGRSTVEQYLSLSHKEEKITCRMRAIWCEKHATLRVLVSRLGTDTCIAAEPAGYTQREPSEYEKPFCTWLALDGNEGAMTLSAEGAFAYRYTGEDVAITLLRNAIYGDLRTEDLDEEGDYAYLGQGENNATLTLRFPDRFSPVETERNAIRDLRSPVVILESNHEGDLPSSASLAELTGEGLLPMALKTAEEGDAPILRLRETMGKTCEGTFRFLDATYSVAGRPLGMSTYRLEQEKAIATDLLENTCGESR